MPDLKTTDRVAKVLIEGIMNNKVVRIRYEKKDKVYKRPKPEGRVEKGDTVTRMLEPYEIKHEGDKEFLWAYDPKARHIKKFNVEGITSARLINKVFQPNEAWIQE